MLKIVIFEAVFLQAETGRSFELHLVSVCGLKIKQQHICRWVASNIFHQDHWSLPQEIWPRRHSAAADFYEAFLQCEGQKVSLKSQRVRRLLKRKLLCFQLPPQLKFKCSKKKLNEKLHESLKALHVINIQPVFLFCTWISCACFFC